MSGQAGSSKAFSALLQRVNRFVRRAGICVEDLVRCKAIVTLQLEVLLPPEEADVDALAVLRLAAVVHALNANDFARDALIVGRCIAVRTDLQLEAVASAKLEALDVLLLRTLLWRSGPEPGGPHDRHSVRGLPEEALSSIRGSMAINSEQESAMPADPKSENPRGGRVVTARSRSWAMRNRPSWLLGR